MVAGASFDRERMREAASDELIAATDIADLLVRLGMPFREAHGVVAGLVRTAVDSGRALSELSAEELARAERAAGRARAGVPRGARVELLARVEGLRGRDLLGAARRAAGAGRADARCARASDAVPAPRPLGGFYDRPVLEVAPELIGCAVVHGGTAGVIVETEAYHEQEPACHAYVGLTRAHRHLFGPPGVAYVYRSYGIHAMLNAVCEPEGVGAAVLIRALRAGRRASS